MQQQRASGFRGFAQTTLGKIVLIVLATLLTFGSYVSLGALLAIPAMLVFGLAFPIWLGLKRPRYLAVLGLVVLLAVAPLATIFLTQEIRSPIGAAESLTTISGTNSTAILQNASVTPYTGSTSTNFTWTVTVFPSGVPKGNTSPIWLNLYISTCPGATSATAGPNYCAAGYPFYLLNFTAFPANFTAQNYPNGFTHEFQYRIGTNGIWDWQMGIYTRNSTTGKLFYQILVGDPAYNGIEGPVVGDFTTTYLELLPNVYLYQELLPLGAPFYVVLLLYMLFKNRERRRKEAVQRAAGPVPPGDTPPSEGNALPSSSGAVSAGSGGPTLTAVAERSCPHCNAVVYENDTKCWKCGQSLDGA